MVVPKSDSYRSSSAKAAKASTATKPKKGKTAADAKKAENEKAQAQEDSKKADSKKQSPKYSLETEIQRLADEERQWASRATQKGATQQKQPSSKAAAPAKTVDRTAAQAARVDHKVDGTGGAQAQSSAATKASASASGSPTRGQVARVERDVYGGAPSTAGRQPPVKTPQSPPPPPAPGSATRGQQARVEREVHGHGVPPAAKPSPAPSSGGWWSNNPVQFFVTAVGAFKAVAVNAVYQIADKTLGLTQGMVDVAPKINQLRNTGDNVQVQVGLGGKVVAMVHPRMPVPLGIRVEDSYDVQITQVAPAPGGTAPRYEVEFGKNLFSLAAADKGIPLSKSAPASGSVGGGMGGDDSVSKAIGVTAIGEAGLASSDRVVMTFDSKAAAAASVHLLGKAAVADGLRDIADIAAPTRSHSYPWQNPLRGAGSKPGPSVAPAPAGGGMAPLGPVVGAVTGPLVNYVVNTAANRMVRPEEQKFLQDHVTGYSQSWTLHGRALLSIGGKVEVPFPQVPLAPRSVPLMGGMTPFLTTHTSVTRTVTLPQDGQPGTVSYGVSEDVNLRESQRVRAQASKENWGPVEASLVPMTLGDTARVKTEVHATWNLSDQEVSAVKASGGKQYPSVPPGRTTKPDSVTVKSEGILPLENPLKLGEVDQLKVTTTTTVKNPAQAVGAMAQGGVAPVVAGLAGNLQGTVQLTKVHREGVNNWWEPGGKLSAGGHTIFSANGSVQVKVVTEEVTPVPLNVLRRAAVAGQSGGAPQPPARGKSDDSSGDADTSRSLPPPRAAEPPVPPRGKSGDASGDADNSRALPPRRAAEPPVPRGKSGDASGDADSSRSLPPRRTPEPPRQARPIDLEPPAVVNRGVGEQLVVVPTEGVNVRTAPDANAPESAALRHGTFVRTTGRTASDGAWVEVRGPDAHRNHAEGWVAKEFLRSHPDGGEGATGRIDFDLRQLGYESVRVKENDTLKDIAARYGINVKDVVVLNRDNHIIHPDLIFPGDILYLPNQ